MTQEGYTHIERTVALFERTGSTIMPQRIMTVPQSGLCFGSTMDVWMKQEGRFFKAAISLLGGTY